MSVIRFATRENIDQQLWPWWLVNGVKLDELTRQARPLLRKSKLLQYNFLYRDNSEVSVNIQNGYGSLKFVNPITEHIVDDGLIVLFDVENEGFPGGIPIEEEAGNIIFIKVGNEVYRNGSTPIIEYSNPSRSSVGIFWQHNLLSDTISVHESKYVASLISDIAIRSLKLEAKSTSEAERDFFHDISNNVIKCYCLEELTDVLDGISQSQDIATNGPFPNPIEEFFLSVEDGFDYFQKSYIKELREFEEGNLKSKLTHAFQNAHLCSFAELQNQLTMILSGAKNVKEKISFLESMHDMVCENVESFTHQERCLTFRELGSETDGNVLWIKRDMRYKRFRFTIERGRFTRIERTLNDVLSLKKWIEAQIKKTTVLEVEKGILNSLREELKAMKKESNETDTTGSRNGHSDSAQIRIIINRIQRHFPNENISRQKIDVWIWSNFFLENGFRYLNIRSN